MLLINRFDCSSTSGIASVTCIVTFPVNMNQNLKFYIFLCDKQSTGMSPVDLMKGNFKFQGCDICIKAPFQHFKCFCLNFSVYVYAFVPSNVRKNSACFLLLNVFWLQKVYVNIFWFCRILKLLPLIHSLGFCVFVWVCVSVKYLYKILYLVDKKLVFYKRIYWCA